LSSSKIGFLDYASAEQISFPYTATKQGLVVAGGGSVTSAGHVIMYVNGTAVGYYSNNTAGQATVSAYVDVGDVVTIGLYQWTLNNQYRHFIPFK
jgi:hypothetical protein